MRFAEDTEFDTVVIQEDIQYGERVREYDLEILLDDHWQPLATGACIGHKRIHRMPAQRARALKLTLKRATALPLVKQLAVYDSQQ